MLSSTSNSIKAPRVNARIFPKAWLTFWLAMLLGIVLFFWREPHSVSHQLTNMPQDEHECLEFFFRSAIAFDSFGYCLFGDKPLSVLVYCKEDSKKNDPFLSRNSRFSYFHPFNKKIIQGWKIWKKNQNKFSMKNYSLIESRNFIDNNFSAIVLINKKAALATIHENLEDFRSVLGKHVTPKSVLQEIIKSNDIFSSVLKDHQGLIGTLLGYGRNNAWLFHLQHKPQSPIKKKEGSNNKLQPFTRQQHFNPLFMNLPGFMVDKDTMETQLLQKKYKSHYQKILKQYSQGDFLEITLQQLTSK